MRGKSLKPLFAALLALFIAIPALAQEGYKKGHHVVSGSLGVFMGANDLDEVKGTGPSAGAAYRYYFTDNFSLGADAAFADFGNHYSDEDETDVDTQLYSTALLVRVDFRPRPELLSYLSLGMGSQYAKRTFHESDGDREDTLSQGGHFLALGFESVFSPNWAWGGELRAMDPLNITGGDTADAVGFKLTLSRRFGNNPNHPQP